MASPPGREAARWQGEPPAVWQARWGVPHLRIFHAVGSTNDEARALADAGAPHGTVVLADEQTRGRGRRGRSWIAAPAQALLLSVVLRPDHGVTGVLPLRVGLAAARAVDAVAGLHVGIKWPNDLVVGSRKLGGVLCEGAIEGRAAGSVVAGIGINVFQTTGDWTPDLRGLATSLAAESDRALDVPTLAARVITEVLMAAHAGATLSAAELDELATRDILRDRRVTVDGRHAGHARDVEPDGALVLEDAGRTRRIRTGTIRLAGQGGEGERNDA